MPSLFFSYDEGYHQNKQEKAINKLDPRIKKAELLDDFHAELGERAKVWAARELRAVLSAKELAEKQHRKYLHNESEWRIRQRVAIQRRQKYEVEFVKSSVKTLQDREDRILRRNDRRRDLLAVYGDRSAMSYTNSGYF